MFSPFSRAECCGAHNAPHSRTPCIPHPPCRATFPTVPLAPPSPRSLSCPRVWVASGEQVARRTLLAVVHPRPPDQEAPPEQVVQEREHRECADVRVWVVKPQVHAGKLRGGLNPLSTWPLHAPDLVLGGQPSCLTVSWLSSRLSSDGHRGAGRGGRTS